MSDNIFYKNLENIIKENKLEELNATQVFESIVYMRSAYDLFFFSKRVLSRSMNTFYCIKEKNERDEALFFLRVKHA